MIIISKTNKGGDYTTGLRYECVFENVEERKKMQWVSDPSGLITVTIK